MNREEAVRKIRWHLLGLVLTDDVREAFSTLIPELTEKGTDEKMLDAILCHVKASNDFTADGVNKEDVVAYLEGKKKKAAIESAYPISVPVKALAIPKFSVGDNVKYQGVTYEITKVEVNDIGPFYSARAIGPIDYDDEIKTVIGPGSEKDMVKVDPYQFEKECNEELKKANVVAPEEYGLRKPAERYDMVAKLEEHLANTPKEQLDAEWKALEKWNDVGPTVEEYIYGKLPKFKVGDKIRKIGGDYASWEITGINNILRLYEGKYEEGYPTELSFEEQDSYELATGEPINAEKKTVDVPVPELRESNDAMVLERIKKCVIYDCSITQEETDECLAYLEKQKDLPTNEEMLITLRAEYEKGIADTIAKYEQKVEWSEEDKKLIDGVINSLCCYQNTLSDYQKEIVGEEIRKLKSLKPQPKPEWSEEEKRKLNRIYEILGYAADDRGFLKSKRIIGDKEAIELQDFLKSLSLNLKKKNEDVTKLCSNEWSEEEYGRLFDIEHYLDGTLQLSPDRKIACIVFLKSLRLQPNHEWSEEEKMNIELLIALLRGKVNLVEVLGSRKETIITFLKSLYSRKPSEVRYYEAWGVPKINGVPVPAENQTVNISGDVRLKGWVKRKTADGTLRLYESKSCEDRGIWVPPWAFKDSWKVCTTDDPIEVEITLKQL